MLGEATHATGIAFALAAAGCFALQYIFLRLGTVHGSVAHVMLITLLTNVAIVVPGVVLFVGVPTVSIGAVAGFVGAGVAGSLVGRVLMFKSVETIGASRTSPVVAANVFVATILAVALFGETLTAVHVLGIVLIVVGVAAISWETAQETGGSNTANVFGLSIVIPLFAALSIGFEPIFIAIGLAAGGDILPGVAIKVTSALGGFVAYLLAAGHLGRHIFQWNEEMKWYLGAGVTSTGGIVCLFAALAVAPVVIVVPLLQTAPLIVLVLSAFFLPRQLELVTWRLVTAAIVVVIGAVLVSGQ